MIRNISNVGASGNLRGEYLSEDFANSVRDLLESWRVPGISVAVIDGDSSFTEVS